MNTIFINLVGGPGSNKTAIAAGLYAALKNSVSNVEILYNSVTRHILQNDTLLLSSQIPIFGEELLQMLSVNGKADICIRDCSLLNNIVYDIEDNQLFHALVLQEYKKFTNIDFFINREGLTIDENKYDIKQCLAIDQRVKDVYRYANIPLLEADANTAVEDIISYIQGDMSE